MKHYNVSKTNVSYFTASIGCKNIPNAVTFLINIFCVL